MAVDYSTVGHCYFDILPNCRGLLAAVRVCRLRSVFSFLTKCVWFGYFHTRSVDYSKVKQGEEFGPPNLVLVKGFCSSKVF